MQLRQLRAWTLVGSLMVALALGVALGFAADRGQQAELFGLLAFVLLAGIASGVTPAPHGSR